MFRKGWYQKWQFIDDAESISSVTVSYLPARWKGLPETVRREGTSFSLRTPRISGISDALYTI